MTGTAKTEEVEFEKTYKLQSTVVPTNMSRQRQDWPDQVFKTEIGNGKQLRMKQLIYIKKVDQC